MVAVAKTKALFPLARTAAWLPLVTLPVAAVWLAAEWPSWVFMWVLAFSIYAGLKWLGFAASVHPSVRIDGRAVIGLPATLARHGCEVVLRSRPSC